MPERFLSGVYSSPLVAERPGFTLDSETGILRPIVRATHPYTTTTTDTTTTTETVTSTTQDEEQRIIYNVQVAMDPGLARFELRNLTSAFRAMASAISSAGITAREFERAMRTLASATKEVEEIVEERPSLKEHVEISTIRMIRED